MISIIIPVFNTADNLHQCLLSVFNQTYEDFEVIVVDDGSINPGAIQQVVAEFPIVQLIRLKYNQGAPVARNTGFKASVGQYVLFLDADVVMQPDMLAKMKSDLLIDSSITFVYSSFKYGKILMSGFEFSIDKLKQNNYIHTSSLLRREAFPGFDENIKKFQDWDLWLTIVEQGGLGKYISEVLFNIIDTNGSISTWLPKFMYKLSWPILGFTPKVLKTYFQARDVIIQKHKL